MRKKTSIILSLVLLFFVILFLFKRDQGIEDVYTSKELACSCGHKGEIHIKNNEINLVHREHGSVDAIGTYKLISKRSISANIDWYHIKLNQELELKEDNSLEIFLIKGSKTILEKSRNW